MALNRNPAARARGPGPECVRLGAEHSDDSLPGSAAQHRRDLNAEARIQAAIVEWIRLAAPSVLVFSIPNEGKRSKPEAARMRWTGLVAGAPDLIVVASNGGAHFIEVKEPRGTLSRDQRNVHGALTALGTAPAVVRSIDDCRRAFQAWGIPTRQSGP